MESVDYWSEFMSGGWVFSCETDRSCSCLGCLVTFSVAECLTRSSEKYFCCDCILVVNGMLAEVLVSTITSLVMRRISFASCWLRRVVI